MTRREAKVVGDGMTIRQKWGIKHAQASDRKEWAESIDAHNADPWASIEKYSPHFQAALEDCIRTKGGDARPSGFKERDELGWYYWKLISDAKEVRRHISDDNAGAAAFRAAHWGETFSELQMKLAREKEWITGNKQHKVLEDTRARANRKRQSASVEQRHKWQAEAERIWSANRALSKSAVAEVVKTRLKAAASCSTIRQALKKPDSAG